MADAQTWMPMFWADYFADTMDLSAEEHGAYLLLIGSYWMRGAPLLDDNRGLARITRTSHQKWFCLRKKLEGYFEISQGLWRHKRIDFEILKSSARLKSARAAGKAGGLAKAKLPTPTPIEETSKKETPAVPMNGNGHLPEGILAEPRTLEAEFYGRGKQILGKSAGGLLTRLLKARDGNVALARASLELASTKEDPREFIGAAIRNSDAEHRPREIAGGRL